MSLVNSLWRALAVYRVAGLLYAAVLMTSAFARYPHPVAGWATIGVMATWTLIATLTYANPARRVWPMFVLDACVAGGCLYASRFVIGPDVMAAGSPTLPMAWVASPVIAAGLIKGRRLAALTALALGAVDLAMRAGFSELVANETVLLVLAGVIISYAKQLAVDAEERTQRAAQIEAAARERERLARNIHDSVLQVLTLVARRGAELGGEAGDLGRLAGEQEATLRALVGTRPAPLRAGSVDVCAELARFAAPAVSFARPAGAVPLPARHATELGAAVGAALSNVTRHCPAGTRVWLLVEDEPDVVRVTVRDDGPGFAVNRLAEAAATGRLGVAQSIVGRLRDLGGSATVHSTPTEGTEVELTVPKG